MSFGKWNEKLHWHIHISSVKQFHKKSTDNEIQGSY